MRSKFYEPLLLNPEYQKTIERIARKQTRGTTISWEDAAQTAYEKVKVVSLVWKIVMIFIDGLQQ